MNRKQFEHFSLTPMDTYVTVRFFYWILDTSSGRTFLVLYSRSIPTKAAGFLIVYSSVFHKESFELPILMNEG